MDLPRLDRDLTTPPPIPDVGIERAATLMSSGRLHRYGEAEPGEAEVSRLEDEFAALIGADYCVALSSCGAAMAVALWAAGVGHGDTVLVNAFTLAPVPGAIAHVGATPALVGITRDLTIDIDDFVRVVRSSGARTLLLSHMRGHIADMDRIVDVCNEGSITLIEDCAHTLGATWDGTPSGRFGLAGCFSTQSYKHVNSGEGGLLVTDDEDVAARAVLLSGSYALYGQHGARPPAEAFARHQSTTPNLSMRMPTHSAALARPQLSELASRVDRWNESHDRLATLLRESVSVPERDPKEGYVGSSIQFLVDGLTDEQMDQWITTAGDHGVHVKWFGRPEPEGFTSRYDHWRYIDDLGVGASSDSVLAALCDLRIPLDLTADECAVIARVIAGSIETVRP